MLTYVGTAHLSLLGAALLALFAADDLAQAYLYARVLASVHLVTLGWLTATALGAIYALLPLVLRTPVAVRWPDVLACVAVMLGSSGVVAHMLLATYSGIAWSGGTIAAGAAAVGLRAWRALRQSGAPALPRVCIPLALSMLVAAASLGALVAIDHDRSLFAGGHLHAIAAHAHLALVGWLLLLVVGVGHRLLPMLLPAHPVPGRRPGWTVALLALGALALPAAWLLVPPPSPWPLIALLPLGAGLALFGLDLHTLRQRAVPRAKDLPRPDPALVLVAGSVACMLAALPLGGALLLLAVPDPGLIALYGVLLLLGGFSGLVLGVGLRLWPIFAWMRAFARTATVPQPTPATLPSYPLQWLVLVAWVTTVALLGTGVATHHALAVRAGALAWTVAALAANLNLALVLLRARFDQPTWPWAPVR